MFWSRSRRVMSDRTSRKHEPLHYDITIKRRNDNTIQRYNQSSKTRQKKALYNYKPTPNNQQYAKTYLFRPKPYYSLEKNDKFAYPKNGTF